MQSKLYSLVLLLLLGNCRADAPSCQSYRLDVAGTRVLGNTISPSRRYALAWALPGRRIDWARLDRGDEHYFDSLDLDDADVTDYLVDLRSKRVVARVKDLHDWHNAAGYRLNHSDTYAVWTKNERQVTFVQRGKWSYRAITMLRLDGDQAPLQAQIGTGLESFVRRCLRGRHGRAYQREAGSGAVDISDAADGIPDIKYVTPDRIKIGVVVSVPKADDGFEFDGTVTLSIWQDGDSLHVNFLSLRQDHYSHKSSADD